MMEQIIRKTVGYFNPEHFKVGEAYEITRSGGWAARTLLTSICDHELVFIRIGFHPVSGKAITEHINASVTDVERGIFQVTRLVSPEAGGAS